MMGGGFTVIPGRLSHFCLDRRRLLQVLLVFVQNSAPGRLP